MKRRWFQIHLSTAIVLMLVASVLLWANTRGFRELIREDWISPDFYYGWPYRALYMQARLPDGETDLARLDGTNNFHPYWMWDNAALNASVALGVLAIVAVGCEWALRRREVRRP